MTLLERALQAMRGNPTPEANDTPPTTDAGGLPPTPDAGTTDTASEKLIVLLAEAQGALNAQATALATKDDAIRELKAAVEMVTKQHGDDTRTQKIEAAVAKMQVLPAEAAEWAKLAATNPTAFDAAFAIAEQRTPSAKVAHLQRVELANQNTDGNTRTLANVAAEIAKRDNISLADATLKAAAEDPSLLAGRY